MTTYLVYCLLISTFVANELKYGYASTATGSEVTNEDRMETTSSSSANSMELEVTTSVKDLTGESSAELNVTKADHDCTTQQQVNPCDPNPCENGGDCYAIHNSFKCRCQHGTSGKQCESVNWCEIKQNGIKGRRYCNKGEARCISNVKSNNFSCRCYNRKKEFDYDSGKCTVKDYCTPNPCKNGGECEMSGYKAQCDCPDGAYGKYCNKVNWCRIKQNEISGADYCNKGEARCIQIPQQQNFTCVCYNRKNVFDEELGTCVEEKIQATTASPTIA